MGIDRAGFDHLQKSLRTQFQQLYKDDAAPRTVLILPSLTLDAEILSKIDGVIHYEQRLLCLLFLLRYPRAHVIYVTSEPLPAPVIDYYLHLLPGIPHEHARRRLTLASCYDGSPRPLTEKILERPRLIERLRAAIADPASAHITSFNVTEAECRLALALGIPIYGCDPGLQRLGTKSGSRTVFKKTGVPTPDGEENISDTAQLVEALTSLKRKTPALAKAVVKLDEGFSGEGNAIFDFEGAPAGRALTAWVRDRLDRMTFIARDLAWSAFEAKLHAMGGIVEAFVDGATKRLPSVQYRIDPLGRLDIISTHDQVAGGAAGQVFEGCLFPADSAYRLAIQDAGQRAAEVLREQGVIGRFGIDFISVRNGDGWRHYAVEINLRKGGTTHPSLMLQHLTDGRYDPADGEYRSLSGRKLCYYASDNLKAPHYRSLTPDDLVDIAVENRLHFHPTTEEGVAFHMIGALSSVGKLGVTCVAGSRPRAEALYRETVAVLDRACAQRPEGRPATA